MTINIQLTTIVAAIAALDFGNGVNNLTLAQIPANAETALPCFFPNPNDNAFITDMTFTPLTFGTGGTAKMNLEYTLNYRYLHAVVGSGGGLLSNYEPMINNVMDILKTIFTNDTVTGAVDVKLLGVPAVGNLSDAGTAMQYHGVDFSLRITEYIQ